MQSKSGVYLLTKGRVEGEAAAYVGQTVNFQRRYSPEVRAALGAWVDVPKEQLDEVEREGVEFCQAFGLPLTNVNLNGGHIAHGRDHHRRSK
jgi:hypothetical protein